MSTLIPHFAVPLHFHDHGSGIQAHVVEQGSDEEILACANTLVRFEKGQRPEYPDFGVTDLTFEEQPLPVERLKAEIVEQDPRIGLIITTKPNELDDLVAHVKADLVTRGALNE